MNEFEAMSEKLNSMGGALWKVIEKERAQNAYLDDPSISERDKQLQWALDHDMEVPADVNARYEERLAYLESHPYPEQSEYYGFTSWEEVRERLREALTSEQRALRAAEYERHAGMVNEALSKGFRKGGNCRRAGGAS